MNKMGLVYRSSCAAVVGVILLILMLKMGWHDSLIGHDVQQIGGTSVLQSSGSIFPKRRFINEIVADSDPVLRSRVNLLVHEGTDARDSRLIDLVRDIMDPPDDHPIFKIAQQQSLWTPQALAVDEILKKKRNGYFIECGAYDGEISSNTLALERLRDWTGLLVEMDPYLYTAIRSRNRRAHSLNACASPHSYPIQLPFRESEGQTGTLDVSKSPTEGDRRVSCFPMETMILAVNRTRIDYLSLDVEGLELDVLTTIPFDLIDIKVLSVEHKHVPAGKEAILAFMLSRGYYVFKDIHYGNSTLSTFVDDFIFVKNDLLT